MSRISVFKFGIDEYTKTELVKDIVNQYLEDNHFNYDSEKMYYIAHQSGKTYMPISGPPNTNTRYMGLHIRYTGHWGFKFDITNNELLIKAFVINPLMKATDYIHSKYNNSPAGQNYYANIKDGLFQALNEHDIPMLSKEIEKINDKYWLKWVIFILGYFVLMAMIVLGVYLFLSKQG